MYKSFFETVIGLGEKIGVNSKTRFVGFVGEKRILVFVEFEHVGHVLF